LRWCCRQIPCSSRFRNRGGVQRLYFHELTVNEAELFLKFKSKNIPEFCIAVDDYTYEAMR
jgi:hypothetical protein